MRDMAEATDQAWALVAAYATGDNEGGELLLSSESADWRGICEILGAYMSAPVAHMIRCHGADPREAVAYFRNWCQRGCGSDECTG